MGNVQRCITERLSCKCWTEPTLCVLGRMDIDINLVEDCRRLAKQCKMSALIEELQNKCKQVYEFGEKVLLNHVHNSSIYPDTILLPSTHTLPHVCVCVFISGALVSNKPGVCVKVLSLESNSCRLQEDMAQLADCAMPPDLRVREENIDLEWNPLPQPLYKRSVFSVYRLQVGFGELPFNRVDHFPTCPDICFRVDGYDFLCHKVFLTLSH